MKIYTRTGDEGTTQLLTGDRVPKDHPRLEAEGCLDELNAWLGVAASHLEDDELTGIVQTVQRRLFVLGALLAGADLDDPSVALTEADVVELESTIDRLTAELPPLKAFILPGGTHPGSLLHVARTVSRRFERRLISLAKQESVPPVIPPFVNRLADLLFTLARAANHRAGTADDKWEPR